jgi:hypothetical protein
MSNDERAEGYTRHKATRKRYKAKNERIKND